MTGCVVTSCTRLPRKYTTRPSRKLVLYCATVRRAMITPQPASFKTPINAVTVIFPLLLPQDVFLDLPRGCFRKFVHKVDPSGTLETGQALAAVRVQGFCSQYRVGFEDHERFRYFAEALVWTRDNRNFEHRGVCVDHALELDS